jgi:hypothetical protein
MTCSFSECGRPVRAIGLCTEHGKQKYRGEDLRPIRYKGPAGKGHLTKDGYRLLYRPAHPNAKKDGYILEHVLVMTAHLGRPLVKSENVHHLNGCRSDNRISNLELWSTSQPPGQRVADKVAWAREIISKYGKDYPE